MSTALWSISRSRFVFFSFDTNHERGECRVTGRVHSQDGDIIESFGFSTESFVKLPFVVRQWRRGIRFGRRTSQVRAAAAADTNVRSDCSSGACCARASPVVGRGAPYYNKQYESVWSESIYMVRYIHIAPGRYLHIAGKI